MPMTQLPFLQFLSGGVALDQSPALCDDKSEGWLRFGLLRDRIKNLLPQLQQTALSAPRGLILCALPRTVDGVVAYLTAAASGHALLLIDPGTMRPDQFILHYEPDWIILASSYHPGDSYSRLDWPLDGIVLWRRATTNPAPIHPDLYALFLPPGPPDSLKTVRLSYRNLSSNIDSSLQALNLPQEPWRALMPMPLSYSFGLSVLHYMLALGGATMLTEQDVKDRHLWDTIQKRDISLMAGVPFHYDYIARAGLDHLRVPRLKTFLQAGGRMPIERQHELWRQISARNGTFYILYGQTEASPRIATLPVHLFPEKIGSAGRVVPQGRLSVEQGRLVYWGENVMMGYATCRADLARDDEMHGRLPLNDEGTVDADGFLYLKG